jgi:RNA polymerase sigma-70 factor (sigma-E family)
MRRDDDTLEDSFVDFVRTRSDHHRRVAVLLAGEWHAGQDLLQASLVKLYRAWPRIDTSSGADAYLHRIMVNQQHSWWRTRWRREIPVDQFPEPGYAEDPAGRYADGQLIRTALARLPHRQRAVLVLRYFADLPEAEVAAILGCSLGSVKTHAHRGIKALRTHLDPGQLPGATAAWHGVNDFHEGGVHVRHS